MTPEQQQQEVPQIAGFLHTLLDRPEVQNLRHSGRNVDIALAKYRAHENNTGYQIDTLSVQYWNFEHSFDVGFTSNMFASRAGNLSGYGDFDDNTKNIYWKRNPSGRHYWTLLGPDSATFYDFDIKARFRNTTSVGSRTKVWPKCSPPMASHIKFWKII